jgi:type IV pilus assembly protein PilM
MEEVIWDHQLIESEYRVGEEREAIIFAVKKESVMELVRVVDEVGVPVDVVQFAPVALYNFLSTDQGIEEPCLALDMGADNTDLIIIDGPRFWVRNIHITGNDLTKAIQRAFNVSFADAERIKINAPRSKSAPRIVDAINPVMKDLASEIHRSLGWYKSISPEARFRRVFLLGNATKTINFGEYISRSLGLDVARVETLNKIVLAEHIDEEMLADNLPTLCSAFGLALQGMEQTRNRINLLPQDYRQKRVLKRRRPLTILCMLGILVLLFLIQGNVNKDIAQFNGALRDAGSIRGRVFKIQKEYKTLQQRIKGIETALEGLLVLAPQREIFSRVFNCIASVIKEHNRKVDPREGIWIVGWEFKEKGKSTRSGPAGTRGKGITLPELWESIFSLECIISNQIEEVIGVLEEEKIDFIERHLLSPLKKRLGEDGLEISNEEIGKPEQTGIMIAKELATSKEPPELDYYRIIVSFTLAHK